MTYKDIQNKYGFDIPKFHFTSVNGYSNHLANLITEKSIDQLLSLQHERIAKEANNLINIERENY